MTSSAARQKRLNESKELLGILIASSSGWIACPNQSASLSQKASRAQALLALSECADLSALSAPAWDISVGTPHRRRRIAATLQIIYAAIECANRCIRLLTAAQSMFAKNA